MQLIVEITKQSPKPRSSASPEIRSPHSHFMSGPGHPWSQALLAEALSGSLASVMSGAAFPGAPGYANHSDGRTVTTAVAPPTGQASPRSALYSLMAQLAGQAPRSTMPPPQQPYADAALAQVLMSIDGAGAGAPSSDLQADIIALLQSNGGPPRDGATTVGSGSGEDDTRGAGRRRSKPRRADPEEDDEDYTEGEEERDGRRRGSRGGPTSSGLGRPIAYPGDPSDEHLTEEERRRLKRRIANRESARRVRQKRQEQMEELQAKVSSLTHQNARLLSHIASAEQTRQGLQSQVVELREALAAKAAETSGLLAEAMALRKALSDRGVDPSAAVAEALNGGHGSGAATAAGEAPAPAPTPAPVPAPASNAPLLPGAAIGNGGAFAKVPPQGIGSVRLPNRPGS